MCALEKLLPEGETEKECFYNCRSPSGSILIAATIISAGCILGPVLVDILTDSVPATVDAFLDILFHSFSMILNYKSSVMVETYLVYVLFSFIAGLVATRITNALLASFILVGICFLGFFVLAFFVIGITINYNFFFGGLIGASIVFLLSILLPCIAGAIASKAIQSRKSCHVIGKGTVVKKR